MGTMLGWPSPHAVRASSRNMARKSFDSEYSGRMIFSATWRKNPADISCSAWYTSAIPPWAMRRTTR